MKLVGKRDINRLKIDENIISSDNNNNSKIITDFDEKTLKSKIITDFDEKTLKYLGKKHIELMTLIEENINKFKNNKEIYDFINNFIEGNNLIKSFPIGISINEVIAHDTYHHNNLKKLEPGDLITIDFGFVKNGNIIDAARSFSYNSKTHNCITDCENYVNRIEEFIRKEIKKNGYVKIQRISQMIDLLVLNGGYKGLDFLGGHNVLLNKVHGNKLILGKPLNKLPKIANKFINEDDILTANEMFCIEIYMSERFSEGNMIKSNKIPVTHYELNEEIKIINELTEKEKKIYLQLMKITGGHAYRYDIHDEFSEDEKKIINCMIKNKSIVTHEVLEFKSDSGCLVKFTQHENTFFINENDELINLTRKY